MMKSNETLHAATFFRDPAFPLCLCPVARETADKWLHTHDFTEIAVVLAGECRYETEFSCRRLHAGDVVVLPEQGVHGYSETDSLSLMNVICRPHQLPMPYLGSFRDAGFSALFMLDAEYCRRMEFFPELHLEDEDFRFTARLLERMYQEQQEARSGWQLMVSGGFLQLLAVLARNYRAYREPGNMPPLQVAGVIDFLNTHYREEISLSALSHKAGMAENTLLRNFKAATGRSPNNYLIAVRLAHAAELLKQGCTVAEAADGAGFRDSNYFARMFRREFGMPPSHFWR